MMIASGILYFRWSVLLPTDKYINESADERKCQGQNNALSVRGGGVTRHRHCLLKSEKKPNVLGQQGFIDLQTN
jgi:hypothetical protein